MDAEGLGRKLLLTPSGDPCRAPEKQTVGTVTAQNANPASTFELSQCRHCSEGLSGPRRCFWVQIRPFFLGDNSILGVFPLFLPLAITAFGGAEGYVSLAIIAFGAFGLSLPNTIVA